MPKKLFKPGDIYECNDGSIYVIGNDYRVHAITETSLDYDPSLYELHNVEKFLNTLIGHVKD